jgi:tryptophan synthase alpha chain
VRSEIASDTQGMVSLIRAANPQVSCVVGFGMSTPEQAARMARASDGAIAGSDIVRMIGEYGEARVEPVADYVQKMAAAVHGM